MAPKEHPIEHHEALLSSLRSDVDAHDERLRVLETSGAVREEKIAQLWIAVGRIERNSDLVQQAVEKLKEKPGKRWENLVGYIIGALAAGFVGWLLAGAIQ